MSRYSCTVLYDASTGCDIEADTPDEAADKAMEESGVTLCHQCAGEIDMGDALGVIVYDESDELVLDSTYHAEEIERLKKRIAELEAALAQSPASGAA